MKTYLRYKILNVIDIKEIMLITPNAIHSYSSDNGNETKVFVICFESSSRLLKSLGEIHFIADDEKISVPMLAEKCKISESYLKKMFVKKIGMTPMKYIIQMKINYACDLISSECYLVSEVARMCRYDDVYYFSRQFKEYVGPSPTLFMQRYKSSK